MSGKKGKRKAAVHSNGQLVLNPKARRKHKASPKPDAATEVYGVVCRNAIIAASPLHASTLSGQSSETVSASVAASADCATYVGVGALVVEFKQRAKRRKLKQTKPTTSPAKVAPGDASATVATDVPSTKRDATAASLSSGEPPRKRGKTATSAVQGGGATSSASIDGASLAARQEEESDSEDEGVTVPPLCPKATIPRPQAYIICMVCSS